MAAGEELGADGQLVRSEPQGLAGVDKADRVPESPAMHQAAATGVALIAMLLATYVITVPFAYLAMSAGTSAGEFGLPSPVTKS